jgi:hypothetical protein
MELGNLIFGNSRGEYEVDRLWEDVFLGFLEKANISFYGHYEGGNKEYEAKDGGFENNVFRVKPYYWGDCTCGFEERANK